MQPSTLAKTVRERTSTRVLEQIDNKKINDPLSMELRDAFFLAQFNIIKLESILKQPLTDLKVPVISWPLVDLPSNKLEILEEYCKIFKMHAFQYEEKFYSKRLWLPLLDTLFDELLFNLNKEYYLSKIERTYPQLRADYAISIEGKEFAPPLLFVELSRYHLSGDKYGHKDELKMGFTLAASLLKMLSLDWTKEKEFLSQLRIYGILGGATSFDICVMYPVFPNEDKSDFYFVFDCSKTELRFHILEYNKISFSQRFCDGCSDQFNEDAKFKYIPESARIPDISDFNPEALVLSLGDVGILNDPVLKEVDVPNTNEYLAEAVNAINEHGIENAPVTPFIPRKKLECLGLFKDGHVNVSSLQVLERVAELVKVQYDLLAGMTNNPNPSLKYDASRSELMISSKSTHTGSSPNKNLETRSEAALNEGRSPSKMPKLNVPSTALEGEIIEFDSLLTGFHDEDKENVEKNESEPLDEKAVAIDTHTIELNNESRSPKRRIYIFKNSSKHEIDIYENEVIRRCACFPKYFGFTDDYEGKEFEGNVRIELEQVIPGHQVDLTPYYESAPLFGSKFLVDIYGALITLHSIGYVHGDVTPGNVGFNEELGIWQLFDFDNARPIEEAAVGKGDYHGTNDFKSQNYLKTGKYGPFDDFVGATKTFMYFYFNVRCFAEMFGKEEKGYFDLFVDTLIKRVDPISLESLHELYFQAVKLLWRKCKKNPREPSIINAKRILKSPNLIKK